ncbi:MAG: demethylmenaquinone methyltransferase/2-methoxy-6-polyprenyl-1,4-benzoquinol methylase [Oleiphilaceae bacterium]|jgi:2-polyprenyl-3-methyl-5-hydroxy-6-metoxy-1,4-benzoquinol methylase
MLDKYKLVGRSYDFLSKLYSGNAIINCKLSMLNERTIGPGSKVLFAGAGQGRDVLRAAELGANVTMVDISPTMMKIFNQLRTAHPKNDQLKINTILGDILKQENFSEYDMVVSNFFLNVFEEDKMNTLLTHLLKLCRQNGHIVIGDFCPLQGGILQKTVQQIYWYSAATAFFAIAGNAIHTIYDYRKILNSKGLEVKDELFFPFLGQNFYHSILAQKV